VALALLLDEMLSGTIATGRTLLTANIKDFIPLDQRYRATSNLQR